MQTLIDLFETLAALGEKIATVNRTGVRRSVVSYREFHDLALKMANLLVLAGHFCFNCGRFVVQYMAHTEGVMSVEPDYSI